MFGFNKNMENKIDNLKIKNLVVSSFLMTTILLSSGCAKNIECDIDYDHAHKYIKDDSFSKYIVSEKEYIDDYVRTDNHISITKDIEELIEFENDNGLFMIMNNKSKIDEIISSFDDYKEYRYKYIYVQPIPHIISNGKTTTTTYTYIYHDNYSWTSNNNRENLTGEERTVHYMYYGYKINKDEKGEKVLEKSPLVDDLESIMYEYPYIKEDFYVKVDANDKGVILDYEDGPVEEYEIKGKQKIRN